MCGLAMQHATHVMRETHHSLHHTQAEGSLVCHIVTRPTSNEGCAILGSGVTGAEGVGGEMEGSESLAGNVVDGSNLGLSIGQLHIRRSMASESIQSLHLFGASHSTNMHTV